MTVTKTILWAGVVMSITSCGVIAPCGRTRSMTFNGTLSVTAVTTPAPGDTIPTSIGLTTDLLFDTNLERRPGVFDDIWNTLLEGETLPAGSGVALTFEGTTSLAASSIARAVLILPTPLRATVEYPITRAFPAPYGLNNPDVFGTRYLGRETLAAAGKTEFALFYGRREFVGPDPLAHEIPQFLATAANGTVKVISDSGRDVRLRIDVVVTDANGRSLRLQGDISGNGQENNNSCTN